MEALVQRVCGEYREMPGLRLTLAQACRLWHMDAATCEAVLTRLVRDRVLLQTRQGHYVAMSALLTVRVAPSAPPES